MAACLPWRPGFLWRPASLSRLASFSQLDSAQKPFTQANTIPSLVSLLSGGNQLQFYAVATLANLAEGSPDGQDAIATAGALPLLIAMLGSGKTQEGVAHALACLTRGQCAAGSRSPAASEIWPDARDVCVQPLCPCLPLPSLAPDLTDPAAGFRHPSRQ